MPVHKKNFQDFYKEVRDQFPQVRELDIWNNYSWGLNGNENSFIMTDLSKEMAGWVSEGLISEALRLMNMVERYLNEADIAVSSIIYTDFLVTIMEANKEVRDLIKKLMGPETEKHYKNLLKLYRERDT